MRVQPDVVIIYNDLLCNKFAVEKNSELPIINFRIVPYVDLVKYKNEKQSLLMNINMLVDSAIMFTEYWKDVAEYQGFTKPMACLSTGSILTCTTRFQRSWDVGSLTFQRMTLLL